MHERNSPGRVGSGKIASVRSSALAVVIAAAAAASAAAAPADHAAVIAIELGADVPAYVQPKLVARVAQGLQATGYTVVPADGAGDCRAGACLTQLGERLGAGSLVLGTVERKAGSTIVDLRLVDAATTDTLASVHEVCDLCGESELEERVGVAASALRQRADDTRAKRAAATPAPAPAAVVAQPIIVTRRHVPKPAIALGGAGLLAVGVGVYLVVIDGRGTCHPGDQPVYPAPGAVIRYPDANNPNLYVCREQYQTETAGFVTGGLGVAAIAAAAAWVLVAHDEQMVMPMPVPGGAGVAVSLSW